MTTRKKGYKIIVMVFVLLACTMLVAFKLQETNVKYIRTNYVSGTHGKTYVIESLEELEEYYNANKEKHNLGHMEKVYSDTTIGFSDATKEYDEEFFKDHHIKKLYNHSADKQSSSMVYSCFCFYLFKLLISNKKSNKFINKMPLSL